MCSTSSNSVGGFPVTPRRLLISWFSLCFCSAFVYSPFLYQRGTKKKKKLVLSLIFYLYLDVYGEFADCVCESSIKHVVRAPVEDVMEPFFPSVENSCTHVNCVWPVHQFICPPTPHCLII